MARPPRKSPSLRRSHGHKELLPTWLILCEGKTEEVLLKQLRGKWRIPSVTVHVEGQIGVPKTIVKYAKEQSGKFDVIWVVFDRDQHPCWLDALQCARDNSFNLAVSNPCIEFWALLLHREQSAFLTRQQAQKALRTEHPGYNHKSNPYLSVDDVLEGCEVAFQRAERLAKTAEADGEPFRCPSTRFHRLLAELRRVRL